MKFYNQLGCDSYYNRNVGDYVLEASSLFYRYFLP